MKEKIPSPASFDPSSRRAISILLYRQDTVILDTGDPELIADLDEIPFPAIAIVQANTAVEKPAPNPVQYESRVGGGKDGIQQ